MASYKVVFKPSVHKDFRSLPKSAAGRIFQHLEALENEPFPRQSIKMSGAENSYRIRVGDYRIVYEVDHDHKQIAVLFVRHRKDIYRKS
jgi:mRNA interferase RelE/StbE